MALISVKNYVFLIKPFWYYLKVISEPVDHNINVFDWRIYSIVICNRER